VHKRNPTGTFWPSALQEGLLVAALADRRDAAAAWQDVQPRFSLDHLERGSYDLLPMVYRNLASATDNDPLLTRLKGIYRKSWVTNNLLVRRTSETAEALQATDVRALFVEGIAFAARFYPELGLRPSHAVDVLVEDEAARSAIVALQRAGWRERPHSEERPGVVRHLFDQTGNVCLMRTRLAIDFVTRGGQSHAHAPLWTAHETLDLGGVAIPVPSPTDTFLAICVLHARAEGGANVQWIVDAKALLANEIDWERLLEIASERRQALRLWNALGYLAALPGPRPPRSILDRLARAKIGGRERLAYLCTAGSIKGPGAMPELVAEHVAATADEPLFSAIWTLPAHLRDSWGLSQLRQVPLAAGRRAIRLLTSGRKEAG
jgi:Uncharacterised nucleotidyltransferase